MKAKILSILALLLFITTCSDLNSLKNPSLEQQKPGQDKPKWVDKLPLSINSYVFVGTGSGKNKSVARKNAIQDVLGHVVLLINATITKESNFSSVYSESTKGDNDSFEKRGYTKIKVKGSSSIKNVRIKATYYEEEEDEYVAYVLAEVPKDTIEEAIEEMEELRERLANTPTVIVAVTITPEKKVSEHTELKNYLEQFYQAQGYNISSVDFDTNKLRGSRPRSHIVQLKKALSKKSKRIIYAVIRSKRVSKSQIGAYSFISVRGTLLITEILLDSGKVMSVQNFRNKGVDTRSAERAFDKLVQNLIEDLFGKQEDDNYY